MRGRVLWLLAWAALPGCAAAQVDAVVAAPATTEAVVLLQQSIETRYGGPDGLNLTRTDQSETAAQALIRHRVDPALLTDAQAVAATDLRFTPHDGLSRHAGVVVITYRGEASVSTAARSAAGLRAFDHTRILTPMVSARHGRTLAILFTETAGDPRVRTTLTNVAAAFARGEHRQP